jgi:hypothetical protein
MAEGIERVPGYFDVPMTGLFGPSFALLCRRCGALVWRSEPGEHGGPAASEVHDRFHERVGDGR